MWLVGPLKKLKKVNGHQKADSSILLIREAELLNID